MTPAAPRSLVCPNCKKPFTRSPGPGRPREYCTPACGAAARRKAPAEPDAEVARLDELLEQIIEEFQQEGTDLANGTYTRQNSAELLTCRAALARQLDDIEALIIARARARGEAWDELAAPLNISAERLRKKWTPDAIRRRFQNRPPRLPASRPPAPGAVIPSQPANSTDESGPPGRTPQQQLAAALSHLQRESGCAYRELADHAGVSASYVSRVMSGERRPSWPVTQLLTERCGADPTGLRPLWEAAQSELAAPRLTTADEAAARFHAYMRSLHLAAARPAVPDIEKASNYTLTATDITSILDSLVVPDWPTTARLVIALCGRPADARPLWNAARPLPTPRRTTPKTPMAEAFG